MNENQVPDPQEGGRYVRNPDGSLTQTHKTEPAASISEPPPVAAMPAAPAAPTEPAQE
jgi:hypothetical protein